MAKKMENTYTRMELCSEAHGKCRVIGEHIAKELIYIFNDISTAERQEADFSRSIAGYFSFLSDMSDELRRLLVDYPEDKLIIWRYIGIVQDIRQSITTIRRTIRRQRDLSDNRRVLLAAYKRLCEMNRGNVFERSED